MFNIYLFIDDQDQQHEPNDTLIESSEAQIHSPDW